MLEAWYRFIDTSFLACNFKLHAVSSLLESFSCYLRPLTRFPGFLCSAASRELFLLMNCFFIGISREWRQNVQIASPYACVACEIQDIKQELQD